MPYISEDFITRKLPKLMQGRDEAVFRDSKLTGFILRARRLGDGTTLSRVFFVDHLLPNGKRPKIQIGPYPTFSADAARTEATTMLQAVARGDDPAAERAAKKAIPTFEELWGDFEREHLSLKKPLTRQDYKSRYNRVLKPAFGKLRVTDITPIMVAALKRKYAHKKTEVNRSIAYSKKMMSFAIEKGWCKDNPFKGVELYKEKPREQWIDEIDMPLFLTELAKHRGPRYDLIRFLAVTGWRISAARLLTWDRVDLRRLTVELEDNETKKTATHLSADAASLIDRQSHRLGYVFSHNGGRTPIGGRYVNEALADICKAAGIAKVTCHVLRHTVATWCAIAGATDKELQQAIGWKTPAMANRYVSRAESLAKRGVERAAAAINIFQKPPADITELKR